MGKSTVAAQCRVRGAMFADSDSLVHQLLLPRGAGFAPVSAAFPEALENGQINRRTLGQLVFANPEKLKRLEQILHPLVRRENMKLIQRARYQRRRLLVLEIPLLYETGAEAICDEVIVVTAPLFLQRQRVLRRGGMTEEKLRQILSRQLPDSQKRRRADAVIQTGCGKAHSFRQVRAFLAKAALPHYQ